MLMAFQSDAAKLVRQVRCSLADEPVSFADALDVSAKMPVGDLKIMGDNASRR